ncbi:hypothetical protein Taro_021830 [Colocasia esculenta]|uniref:Uncharacterized protein n=1 Tax=Colocasia esculenta TaxID=4460 RepID=A0A843V3J9_COLES|nr:hypothetical protein [Colocasia esculenta]
MNVGYRQMPPWNSLLPPGAFNDDLFKEWLAYLNNVLTFLGPHREAFLIQRARRLDDVWSVVSSDTVSPRHLAQPETHAGSDISLPMPSPEVANSPHDGAGIPFDDLMTMMEGPLPTTDRGALQDITAVVEPTVAETPPFPSIEATSDQGNPLPVSISITLNEEKSEPPAPSHPLLDPSVPHEEKGALAEPLSQPSDPGTNYEFPFVKCNGQDDLSPVPDFGMTNNNGSDSFVPMPPALDLPFVVEKVEVAIKPFEHLSDVENSNVTSPLDASEPDYSETYVISDDQSERTEPLSGETQQLSITFEAACDDAELSSHSSLDVSGLDRSPQALEVLEGWLAALRGEAIGTAGQISMREESARATLLRMLASCLDRSVAEDMQHSIALIIRLLSLEVEQNRIHVAIAVLEAKGIKGFPESRRL